MSLADFCMFVGFFLCISVRGVQGQAHSICALKGSSVDLPCSAQRPTSGMKWFTVNQNNSKTFYTELPADGKKYNMSEENNNTLTIKDLTERDAKFYCCSETDSPVRCWPGGTELHVADLQVKVIPSTEGQTVTLICNTSCPLTEKPAAYIWYKNRELLYQDWSPWYQQLVSSEEGVRYSCAVKGYEHLRAPEVSVDSVTSTCFTVSYAKGTMCPNNQSGSTDEPCSITYPREIHVQKTLMKNCVTLACASSCPTADLHTSYRLYGKTHFEYCGYRNQAVTVFNSPPDSLSCAIQGNEELHSAEVCIKHETCTHENYVSRRICALEGSSVNISIKYYDSEQRFILSKLWYKIKTGDPTKYNVIHDTGRVKYYDNVNDHYILTIHNLQRNDSAGYMFQVHKYYQRRKEPGFPRVTLVVTGLRVNFNPSAEVTEGQRVTLICSTSCPLTDDTNYIWYLNGRPLTLPETQNKHLVLDPVSMEHAGNYSCTVKTQDMISSEETLTVKPLEKSILIMNALKLTFVLLFSSAVFLFNVRIRKKKTLTSAGEAK